ncbi:hypothetical protein CA13_44710 [Planctomycetes bacterium CA13]|uniref:DUF447 family protein n=1 Tax=Novipirellula herctigrandis TaxID=2527986 RepID=A0A5C5Z6X0_9BACT|nr:hypothetical protein CA13_44710 [Planctomycetes bacterium CA13]
MIVESIVTTSDACGRVNIAPMGPTVGDDFAVGDPLDQSITLRPFDSSKTYRNLTENPRAVVHVTDDVDLFVRAALNEIGDLETATELVDCLDDSYWVLRDCHRWFAVDVVSNDGHHPRLTMQCRVVRSEIVRPFFGFNRAKNAVIEAAILGTRTSLLPRKEIESELSRLEILIDKTAGRNETTAFERIRRFVANAYCNSAVKTE